MDKKLIDGGRALSAVVQNTRLKPNEKLILLIFGSRQNFNTDFKQWHYISFDTMTLLTSLSRRTVVMVMNSLVENGYFEKRTTLTKNGRNGANEYRLTNLIFDEYAKLSSAAAALYVNLSSAAAAPRVVQNTYSSSAAAALPYPQLTPQLNTSPMCVNSAPTRVIMIEEPHTQKNDHYTDKERMRHIGHTYVENINGTHFHKKSTMNKFFDSLAEDYSINQVEAALSSYFKESNSIMLAYKPRVIRQYIADFVRTSMSIPDETSFNSFLSEFDSRALVDLPLSKQNSS